MKIVRLSSQTESQNQRSPRRRYRRPITMARTRATTTLRIPKEETRPLSRPTTMKIRNRAVVMNRKWLLYKTWDSVLRLCVREWSRLIYRYPPWSLLKKSIKCSWTGKRPVIALASAFNWMGTLWTTLPS
uniref:Uncharacterized protein n=1 Tax=Cacopsylla melanoneura TaxID=428564 RepID=A0A8D9DMA7_9HEMI